MPTREDLASYAEREAKQGLALTSITSTAYLRYCLPLLPAMRECGHYPKTGFTWMNWCGAFALHCARLAGYPLPDKPDGFYATFALVAAWKYWGKQQGFLVTDKKPKRGDIVIFQWNSGDPDHIGICTRDLRLGTFSSAEGNRDNLSGVFLRRPQVIDCLLRLPDNWSH